MTEQLTLIARLTAKPDQADALGEGLVGLVDHTRAEEGCIDYRVHRDNDDQSTFVLYENWRSRADLDAHFKQPYTEALMKRLPSLLAKDMELTFCTMMSP
jgi:quinol monooxygenase YgiN